MCPSLLSRAGHTDDDAPPGLRTAFPTWAETFADLSALSAVGLSPTAVPTVLGQSPRTQNPMTSLVISAMMAEVEKVEVVVAHHERATVRVGDVFLKIDTDQRRTDVEVEAMVLAPIPTPDVLWRKPPVLALAPLRGKAAWGRPGAHLPERAGRCAARHRSAGRAADGRV